MSTNLLHSDVPNDVLLPITDPMDAGPATESDVCHNAGLPNYGSYPSYQIIIRR